MLERRLRGLQVVVTRLNSDMQQIEEEKSDYLHTTNRKLDTIRMQRNTAFIQITQIESLIKEVKYNAEQKKNDDSAGAGADAPDVTVAGDIE